jgi:hypothetical protein
MLCDRPGAMLRRHVWQLRRALPVGVVAAVLLSACGGGSKPSIAERARDRLVVDSSLRPIAADSERVPDGWLAGRYYFGPLPGKTPKNPVSGDTVVWDPVPTQGIGGETVIAQGQTRPEGMLRAGGADRTERRPGAGRGELVPGAVRGVHRRDDAAGRGWGRVSNPHKEILN